MTHDWTIDWVLFFDEYASDFHPTFQKELAQQLFRKGSSGTGIKQFDKYNFQLIVGFIDLNKKVVENKVFVKIEFITPTSFSFPIEIYWNSESSADLQELHKQDTTGHFVTFNWADNFPIQQILPHIKPYRVDKKSKTNLKFDVEYYYYSFPDISLEFHFSKALANYEINSLDTFLSKFNLDWNEENKGKEIEFISNVKELENNVYEVVADLGLKSTKKTIDKLLKSYSTNFEHLTTLKITIK